MHWLNDFDKPASIASSKYLFRSSVLICLRWRRHIIGSFHLRMPAGWQKRCWYWIMTTKRDTSRNNTKNWVGPVIMIRPPSTRSASGVQEMIFKELTAVRENWMFARGHHPRRHLYHKSSINVLSVPRAQSSGNASGVLNRMYHRLPSDGWIGRRSNFQRWEKIIDTSEPSAGLLNLQDSNFREFRRLRTQ